MIPERTPVDFSAIKGTVHGDKYVMVWFWVYAVIIVGAVVWKLYFFGFKPVF